MGRTAEQINAQILKTTAGGGNILIPTLVFTSYPDKDLKKHYKMLEPERFGKCSGCNKLIILSHEVKEPATGITYQLLKMDYKTTQYLCKDCATLEVI